MKLKSAPVVMIFLGVVARLLPHPPNVAPITAMALFSGVYLPKRLAFIIPLSALLISDYFLGFYGATMFYVYFSFALIGLVGLWVKTRKSSSIIAGAALFSSLVFYLITNFGVWASTNMYSKDIMGLLDSYIMALPFYRNTIIGDLAYTGAFFGAYEIARYVAKQYLPAKFFRLAFN